MSLIAHIGKVLEPVISKGHHMSGNIVHTTVKKYVSHVKYDWTFLNVLCLTRHSINLQNWENVKIKVNFIEKCRILRIKTCFEIKYHNYFLNRWSLAKVALCNNSWVTYSPCLCFYNYKRLGSFLSCFPCLMYIQHLAVWQLRFKPPATWSSFSRYRTMVIVTFKIFTAPLVFIDLAL